MTDAESCFSTADEKTRLRCSSGRRRRAVGDERLLRSAEIVRRVLELPEIANANAIFCYVSYKSEVHTHDLIRALLGQGKTISVPKLGTSKSSPAEVVMQPHLLHGWDDLTLGRLGILEPTASTAWDGTIDVCLTPGLAFTECGDRLGYGRGYYDRFFAGHPSLVAIALAFECQIVASIPHEPHDRRMDVIVTEKRVLHPKKPGGRAVTRE